MSTVLERIRNTGSAYHIGDDSRKQKALLVLVRTLLDSELARGL